MSEPPARGPEASGPERRTSARRACLLQVRYRGAEGWHPATAVDVSDRGCRLRVGEDLARGAVRVAFVAPGGVARPIEAAGTVVWCRLEGLSYQAGIHFGHEEPKLLQLLA